MFEATKIVYQNEDWISTIFIVILFVLALNRVLFHKRVFHINTVLLSKKYLLIYFAKEKNKAPRLFQISLFFVQLLTLSLVLYFLNYYFQLHEVDPGFKSYTLIFYGVCMYFFLRYVVGLFLATLFNLRNEHARLSYDKMSYFINLTLWMLPLLVLSVYMNKFQNLLLEITFTMFVILLSLRYILILQNNKKLIFNNLFYFILYLCALEIAPLIIILKLTI